ncbi:MAG: GNAT family N-acetyltransferase [Jiangellales bacterium]
MSGVVVRPGLPGDADAVAAVCRATANAGEPQPPDVTDPSLVELVYARPYLALEPATARVLLDGAQVTGYVVGALVSHMFYRRWQTEWAPVHLPRPEGADPGLVRLMREPLVALPPGVDDYPSHLHINLLPNARGGGRGLALLESFAAGLRAAGSPGIHLRVDAANVAAIGFYERAGFRLLTDGATRTMVRRLSRSRG